MNIILKIAKTELRTLFYSPIAWFLMIVFMIQCGNVYFNAVEMLSRQQEIYGLNNGFYSDLTDRIFLSIRGLFPKIMGNLYLYIPLLTMGLISREMNSGTIKLLYSSPINVGQIVAGKYLAMIVYSLILVMVMGVFLICGMFHIDNAQTPMLFSAMFGFFLLLAAYSAIGIFMSSLTSYQVVAAISTFVTIGFLSYIGTIWQTVPFVREITYYLSIGGRAQTLLSGLITTREVMYFLVIVYMFLGFTVLKLKLATESKSNWQKAARYAVVTASALLIGYISSIHGLIGYLDVTYGQKRTLTPQVQEILADLGDEPLKVTAYANMFGRHFYFGAPASYKQNQARWGPYFRFKNDIELETVMYYDSTSTTHESLEDLTLKERAERFVKARDLDLDDILTPQQIREQIDLSEERDRYVMQLEWNENTTFLRVFDDMRRWPSETEVAAAMLRLQQADLPLIAFVTGNLERAMDKSGDRDYETLTNLPSWRHSLINQGFNVTSINLEREEIPGNVSALVLADPRVKLSNPEKEKLDRYIAEGGNMVIAGEPVEEGSESALAPILDELGIMFNSGMIIQASEDNTPDFVQAYVQEEAGPFYKLLERVVEDSIRMTMPGVATIQYSKENNPYEIVPLVESDGKTTWNRTSPIDLDAKISARIAQNEEYEDNSGETGGQGHMLIVSGTQGSDSDANEPDESDTLGVVTFRPEQGDIRGPLTTTVALTRSVNDKEQRIVIAGDADFLSNKEIGRGGTSNFIFSTSLFRWLSYGEYPVDTSRPESKDKTVSLTLDEAKTQRVIFQWVLPGLVLVFGAVVLIRRKRK